MQQLVRWCVVAMAGLGVACGEVKNNNDAGPGDAEIDAMLGPVKATVLTTIGDGLPDPTAKLLFLDPDGNVVSDTAVDAMGHAQAMLPRGGTVSAIRIITDTAATLSASITTISAVKPGDDLTFGVKASATITNQGGQTTMTATFPLATGATSYQFYTPCGFAGSSTASPVTLSFRDSCHGATFDLLGIAFGPTTPLFLRLSNVNYQSNGSFNIPAGFGTMANYTVNLSNIPDVVSSLSVSRNTMIENLPVYGQGIGAGDPPAGTLAVLVPYPQGVGPRSELSISMLRPDAQHNERHEVHTATLGTSANVDLGKQQLPWFSNITQTLTGGTWTMVAPGDAPDGMMTRWSGRWTSGARSVFLTWFVVQPADMAGATLPKLPVLYSNLDPGQQTVAVTPTSMIFYMADYDNLTSYDELRQMPETLLLPSIGSMGAFVGMPFQRRLISFSVAFVPKP
jgi:hypothetical protein